jgi:hypothetical protein
MSSQDAQTRSGAEIISVSCNHCGAPLSAPTEARLLTCTYCGARLEVLRGGGAAFTRVLGDIDQRTQRIERDVSEIKLRERIEQLDREWMIQRDQFMVRDRRGNRSLPGGGALAVPAIVCVCGLVCIFGIFWTITAANAGAPGFFVFFGVVFVLFAIVGGLASISKVNAYAQAQEDYQNRRQAMLRDLESRDPRV